MPFPLAYRCGYGMGAKSGMGECIACFVLAGGIGSRLWPLSRQDCPKQFHDLTGAGPMLARTLRRLKAREPGATTRCVIASERHGGNLRDALAGEDLEGVSLVLEPAARNTAAAVAVAALHTLATDGDRLVLIVPSDHEIDTDRQFWETVEHGIAPADAGRIVVFGVPPDRPETGYGYIEAASGDGPVRDVLRFVEKPDGETASSFLSDGGFFWNAGIFLARASRIEEAFACFRPDVLEGARAALAGAKGDGAGLRLRAKAYLAMPAQSFDHAILEKAGNIAMVPARFSWNDIGSWRSLREIGATDAGGNVAAGDVMAIDCRNSYLRGDGCLVSVVGLDGVAVVATPDAVFVAPLERSQDVRKIVARLDRAGRDEVRRMPSRGRDRSADERRGRVRRWLFEEALPLWSTSGVDGRFGGFHEALGFDARPLAGPKRIRTMARQVYAFAAAAACGWEGPADALIAHGLDFMAGNGRTARGGWVRALHAGGGVADSTEDCYDHACVLLALAHARGRGHRVADALARETLAFMDAHLSDWRHGGFHETVGESAPRRSNSHMHLLEAFLAWHETTGDDDYLRRAAQVVTLFTDHFFDAESWTLGEYFDRRWRPVAGAKRDWTEPGHQFEWAALLVDFAARTGRRDLIPFARKLYASALANGINRTTGLAYGAVSRAGEPLDPVSRSWPQAEALKAVIALDAAGGPDLKPEIEERVERLFRRHIDPAPRGLWIDRIDQDGRACVSAVPASILYHLVCALTRYLDAGARGAGSAVQPTSLRMKS